MNTSRRWAPDISVHRATIFVWSPIRSHRVAHVATGGGRRWGILSQNAPASGEAGNCQGKFLWLGRLRNMFLITGVERTLPIAIASISGEGDRRCESTVDGATIPDPADQAIAVFTRHSDVGHDDVRLERVQFSERVIGGSRNAGCRALLR